MSQENLALLADVDRTYIGNVERGQSNVAVLVLLRIVKALDMRLTLLLKEAGVGYGQLVGRKRTKWMLKKRLHAGS